MRIRALLAKVGKLTRFPEAAHIPRRRDVVGDFGLLGQPFQYGEVDGLGRKGEAFVHWPGFKIADQHIERLEARVGLAPEKAGDGGEAVVFDGVDFLFAQLQRGTASIAGKRAEAAIGLMSTRSARDLCHFRRDQPPLAQAVELRQGGERYVMDIEIKAHADGVGRYDIVNLTRLEQFDLSIARLW